MRVCVISNGPSAALYEPDGYDMVIGANWSWIGLGIPVDVWLFNDAAVWAGLWEGSEALKAEGMFPPRPVPPCVVTRSIVPDKLESLFRFGSDGRALDGWARWRAYTGDVVFFDLLPEWMGRVVHFTGLTALRFACTFHPSELIVYGADMAGNLDGIGHTGASRTDTRWDKHERLHWQQIVDETRVSVTRHTLNGTVLDKPRSP